MMSKLVPSPDWFVGLDSLNLCENGHFIDSVTVEVRTRSKNTSHSRGDREGVTGVLSV